MKRLPRLYIGTNTKMFMTAAEAGRYLKELGSLTADIGRERLTLFVIPSFTSLHAAGAPAEAGQILLGAQNMCWEERGAYTGEISPLMLKEAGVRIAEIGHSERRHVFGETDQEENRKVLAALEHGFTPLLCVGETAAQKEYGIADEVLRMQLKIALHGVPAGDAQKLWIAYEPVWAIGEGGVPAPEAYVQRRHAAIRQALSELYGDAAASAIPVLYGGSVNNDNAVGYIACEDVDGLFVGRSAWDAKNFDRLIRRTLAAC